MTNVTTSKYCRILWKPPLKRTEIRLIYPKNITVPQALTANNCNILQCWLQTVIKAETHFKAVKGKSDEATQKPAEESNELHRCLTASVFPEHTVCWETSVCQWITDAVFFKPRALFCASRKREQHWAQSGEETNLFCHSHTMNILPQV